MYPDRIHVLAVAGSLRERSLNRSLLEASRELAPETMAIEIFDLKEIPLYNQDLDAWTRRIAAPAGVLQEVG